MKIKAIHSRDAVYQKFEVLKTNRNKRYKYGEFFVEGVRNINEAHRHGWRFSSFLFDAERPLSGWAEELLKTVETDVNYALDTDLMAQISGKENASEMVAVVQMREEDLGGLPLSDNPFVVLSDRPSNRGNLGTILRSCDSFGVDGLLITGHAVDLYDPEVIGASMGSFFGVQARRVSSNDAAFAYVDSLRASYPGLQVVGTTAHRETPLTRVDFTRPTLLLIGNETDGLSRSFKEYSDILATIPMSAHAGASSLNVGCAATVFLYEAMRQRGEPG